MLFSSTASDERDEGMERRLRSSSSSALRFACVGSGPAGMYITEKLLSLLGKEQKQGRSGSDDATNDNDRDRSKRVHVEVDIFEKEFSPYGLVRFGVAPDHASTKNVTNKFDTILKDSRVRFFGNVKVGETTATKRTMKEDEVGADVLTVSVRELLGVYSGVVLAHGAADNDRKIGLEREDELKGVYGARQFVNWFNGLPSAAPSNDKELHESICERLGYVSSTNTKASDVVVIGVGNVALDCARILLRSTEELAETDIATHALVALKSANVSSVTIIGRRSVAQAKFSPKELREVLALPNIDVEIDDLEVSDEDVEEMNASRPRRRAFEVLEKAKTTKTTKEEGEEEDGKNSKRKVLRILFLKSPTSLIANENNNKSLAFVKVRKNILKGETGNRKAVLSTNEDDEMTLPCDILIRSVGYVGDRIEPSVVQSDMNGTIAHDGQGRAQINETTINDINNANLYVCGWAKRGANGVIATNVQCAEETAFAIREDFYTGKITTKSKSAIDNTLSIALNKNKNKSESSSDLNKWKKNPLIITSERWFKIDEFERSRGRLSPRKKLVSINDLDGIFT
jgi:adrenodoxin-NADP+ reductase